MTAVKTTTGFKIVYEPDASCVASCAAWTGRLREALEEHFGCANKGDCIAYMKVDEDGITAYFVKAKR